MKRRKGSKRGPEGELRCMDRIAAEKRKRQFDSIKCTQTLGSGMVDPNDPKFVQLLNQGNFRAIRLMSQALWYQDRRGEALKYLKMAADLGDEQSALKYLDETNRECYDAEWVVSFTKWGWIHMEDASPTFPHDRIDYWRPDWGVQLLVTDLVHQEQKTAALICNRVESLKPVRHLILQYICTN